MKNFVTLSMALILGFWINAQNTGTVSDSTNQSYWQISPRIGYDIVPIYNESFEYIDYDGGIEFGFSVNKYWRKWGIQFDFDYIKNTPVPDGISSPVWVNIGSSPAQYNLLLNKDDITRWALTIGPSYKYENGSFSWENALLFGIGKVKGGEFLLTADTDPTGTINDHLITYHSGFRNAIAFTGKFQTRFNYFFNRNFGIHFGAYYINHFNVSESKENKILDSYYSGRYKDLYYAVAPTSAENYDTNNGSITVDAFGNDLNVRGDNKTRGCCGIDVGSIGIFGGLSFKLGPKEQKCQGCIYCDVCGNYHLPPKCCDTCPKGCTVSITAKDKFTGKILDNVDVVLENSSGVITNTDTTTSMGVVVFEDVEQGNYTIKGKLYDIDLENGTISADDFAVCKSNGGVITKEILYTDNNFILKGNVIECNTSVAIPGVNVRLTDKYTSSIKNTFTDNNGQFIFHLKQASSYEIFGEKDGYYSVQPLEVNTDNFDRNNTLEIDFEMCIDPCGKAVKLDNIQFNTDKWDILPAAYPDLRKVLQIMSLNPNVKIIMSSHTDSRGSDAYNMDLSQKRAQSTVNWLVANGADPSRLDAVGKGESEPIVLGCGNGSNCTDEEHRPNRRTEFKVVCN